MGKFADIVNQDTPRLVVTLQYPAPNQETWSWGMVGQFPLLGMIGTITRAQTDLYFRSLDNCGENSMVIAWDKGCNEFHYFVDPELPTDSLVGYLELVKSMLIMSPLAQMAKSQVVSLYGPDGKPMRRG